MECGLVWFFQIIFSCYTGHHKGVGIDIQVKKLLALSHDIVQPDGKPVCKDLWVQS